MLLKVRLNLLLDHYLKHLLKDSRCISINGECVKVFNSRGSSNQNKFIIHDKARYFNQSMINIIVSEGYYAIAS